MTGQTDFTLMDLEDMLGWASQALRSEIIATRRLTAGNARLTVQLTLAGQPERHVVLRHESGAGPLAGTVFSLDREAAVCRALEKSSLPVPKVLAEEKASAILLTEWLTGEEDSNAAALDDYLRCLGRLHAIDPASLELPGFAASIAGEIDLWSHILSSKAPHSSAVANYGFGRLTESIPVEPSRVVLCHGDAGTGNYLRTGGRVTAMLDWEMAHFGDPLDDLAWITIRAAQLGIDLGDFGSRIRREYGDGVNLLDSARIDFWQAFGLLRMLVICLAAAAQPRSGKERLLQMTLIPVIEFQLLEALAVMEGRSVIDRLNTAPLESASLPADLLREAAADINDALLPKIRGDGSIENWAKRIRNLLKQIASAAPAAHSFADGMSLDALADQAASRLRWLPTSCNLARRRLARLTPAPAAAS
jgi:aminoglycoside phosphotransferase (APT) family kinase protein